MTNRLSPKVDQKSEGPGEDSYSCQPEGQGFDEPGFTTPRDDEDVLTVQDYVVGRRV